MLYSWCSFSASRTHASHYLSRSFRSWSCDRRGSVMGRGGMDAGKRLNCSSPPVEMVTFPQRRRPQSRTGLHRYLHPRTGRANKTSDHGTNHVGTRYIRIGQVAFHVYLRGSLAEWRGLALHYCVEIEGMQLMRVVIARSHVASRLKYNSGAGRSRPGKKSDMGRGR